MLAIIIISSILALILLVLGIRWFNSYIYNKYNYPLFNKINIAILAVTAIITVVVIFACMPGYDIDPRTGEHIKKPLPQFLDGTTNLMVCVILNAISLLAVFIRNLVKTSFIYALPITLLQAIATTLFLIVILAVFYKLTRKPLDQKDAINN